MLWSLRYKFIINYSSCSIGTFNQAGKTYMEEYIQQNLARWRSNCKSSRVKNGKVTMLHSTSGRLLEGGCPWAAEACWVWMRCSGILDPREANGCARGTDEEEWEERAYQKRGHKGTQFASVGWNRNMEDLEVWFEKQLVAQCTPRFNLS